MRSPQTYGRQHHPKTQEPKSLMMNSRKVLFSLGMFSGASVLHEAMLGARKPEMQTLSPKHPKPKSPILRFLEALKLRHCTLQPKSEVLEPQPQAGIRNRSRALHHAVVYRYVCIYVCMCVQFISTSPHSTPNAGSRTPPPPPPPPPAPHQQKLPKRPESPSHDEPPNWTTLTLNEINQRHPLNFLQAPRAMAGPVGDAWALLVSRVLF